MQIVFSRDNLDAMSNSVFWGEKVRQNILNVSSVEFDQSTVILGLL